MYAHTRHTSPTPPHYLATRLLLLDCCTRRFRPYTVPIQWPDGSARPPNCPPRLLCIVPASTAPPGVSRRLSVEEVPATPAMALMVMVVHLLQRGVLRRSETEFCAVRSAHASREVLDRSLSCGRSVDAIGTLQRLMSTASVLEHRAHQRRQMKLVGAHQPRSRSVPGDRTRDAIFSHRVLSFCLSPPDTHVRWSHTRGALARKTFGRHFSTGACKATLAQAHAAGQLVGQVFKPKHSPSQGSA